MRPADVLLQDMLEAIDEIESCLPSSLEAFHADKFLRSHVLRQVQIIGEAAWRLPDEVKQKYPGTPWRRIVGMRHVLVHDYFQVNWDLLYTTARDQVPPLRAQAASMLRELKPPSGPTS